MKQSLTKCVFSLLCALPVSAFGQQMYDVTVTNITKNQRFTPRLVVTHRNNIELFSAGTSASPQLKTLAEEGSTAPFEELLSATEGVVAAEVGAGLLDPGVSQTVRVSAQRSSRISIAAMLIPTNDTFFGLNRAELPLIGSATYFVPAYDAGTEINDELCSSIPGPMFAECGGPGGGAAVGGGEGAVHISNGMHGIGNFTASSRDWRNPVARIVITRVKK